MLTDRYGHPLSTTSAVARDAYVEGCQAKLTMYPVSIEAFDRQFVFVGLTTRTGREYALLTGSAEVKESQETASVLAVLDATNRWIDVALGEIGEGIGGFRRSHEEAVLARRVHPLLAQRNINRSTRAQIPHHSPVRHSPSELAER